MSAHNTFTLSGRLAADPEIFPGGPTGTTRAKYRIAVDGYNRSTKSREANFFPVTSFGRDAETVQRFCKKGSFISITGELRINEWVDKNGANRRDIQLVTEDVALGPKQAAVAITNTEEDPFGFSS